MNRHTLPAATAVAILLVLGGGPILAADGGPDSVALWNKLGSLAEVENGEIGGGGSCTEPVGFRHVTHDAGVALKSGTAQILFPRPFGDDFPAAGAIEFWWEPEHDENWGGTHYTERHPVVVTSDVRGPSGWPALQLRMWYGGHSSTYHRTALVFRYYDASTGTVYTDDYRYDLDFSAGQRMHVAITWDESRGSSPLRLHVDGVEQTPVREVPENPEGLIGAVRNAVANGLDYRMELLRFSNRPDGPVHEFDPEMYVDNLVLRRESRTDPTDPFNEHPFIALWNKLGSAGEVLGSEIGPDLEFYDKSVHGGGGMDVEGDRDYVPGMFGNSVTLGGGPYGVMQRIHNLVLSDVNHHVSLDRGTIEAWYRQEDDPAPYSHNPYRIVDGSYGLNHCVGFQMNADPPPARFYFGLHGGCGGATAVIWTERSWANGDWVHVAGVWDRDGIDGTSDTMRLYVDGDPVAATTDGGWGSNAGSKVDIVGGNDNNIVGKFRVDNLVIRNYAKTSFADRFSESPLNAPPVADAGEDEEAECSSYAGTMMTLDGAGCSDPDSTSGTHDDIVMFEWFEDYGLPSETPLGIGEVVDTMLPLGAHVVTLRVTDAAGATDTDEAVKTVVDTTPPSGEIVLPDEASCHGPASLPVVVTDDFTDVCDPDLERLYDPGPGPDYAEHGDYLVTVTASDCCDNDAEDSVGFVIDTVPPVVEILDPPDRARDIEEDLPIELVFTSSDDDGATGDVEHEIVKIDDCVAYDGLTYGDGDGLLGDESIDLGPEELCRIAELCGFTSLVEPELRVEATDCGGNLGQDSSDLLGGVALTPGLCAAIPLRVADASGTVASWTPFDGAIHYDVIRGNLAELSVVGDEVDLGTVVCVENDSPDATTNGDEDPAVPEPGSGFFYLVQSYDGALESGYGTDSAGRKRVVLDGNGDCP